MWGINSSTRTCSKAEKLNDDERLGPPLGDQVVHDQPGVALVAPTCLVLAPAVLEVEHGVAPVRVLLVVGRRVDEAAADGVGAR